MSPDADAVIYRPEDYAPVSRRIGALLIDLVVFTLLVSVITGSIGRVTVPEGIRSMPDTPERTERVNEHMRTPKKVGFLGGCLLYYICIRRLRGGTLGYRLMGIRLVDKTGNPPSWRVLVKRFLLAAPLTLPLGASYLCCIKNPKRQAVHDQWSGTWVVRRKAKPAGPAMTAYLTKLLGTLLLRYIDVEPWVPQPPAALAGEANPEAAETTSTPV
jgi:uncharacterized RDD family membrane protein YckC